MNNRTKSPLQARNASILAHGFDPMSEEAFKSLWQVLLSLAGVTEADLPSFPRLGDVGPGSGPKGP
jgi:hypothetical protein